MTKLWTKNGTHLLRTGRWSLYGSDCDLTWSEHRWRLLWMLWEKAWILHKLYPGVEKTQVDHHGSREKNMIFFFFLSINWSQLVCNIMKLQMLPLWAWNVSHADRNISYSQPHSQKNMSSDFQYPDQWSWRRPDALRPLWWPRSSPHCQGSCWDTVESGSLHWGLWQSLHILNFQRKDFKSISRKLK